MRFVAGPRGFQVPPGGGTLIRLYSADGATHYAGAGLSRYMAKQRLAPAAKAWDFMSIALAAVTADQAQPRSTSPDGWTREFDLHVAVDDPAFWQTTTATLEATLGYLTTDRWTLSFHPRSAFTSPQQSISRDADTVSLLSGGLDSLIGAIDLSATDRKPLYVSHTEPGDAAKQRKFAQTISPGAPQIQAAHAAHTPAPHETSQRSRSLVFIALGVLGATTISTYSDGEVVPLVLPENGYIAINPPLTPARVGSLSTRTAHPTVLGGVQELLSAADLRVEIQNPYEFMTKGEMLDQAADKTLTERFAASSTSCGRFRRFNYTHCGRCVPCQVRRAAFLRAGVEDSTEYVYENLGVRDTDHAGFPDVRDVGLAIERRAGTSIERWAGASLASEYIDDTTPYLDMLNRAIAELNALHDHWGVK